MENKDIIEMEDIKEEETKGSTLEKGNYLIEVISEGKVIRKIAVAGAEINVSKLAEGGITVDLK